MQQFTKEEIIQGLKREIDESFHTIVYFKEIVDLFLIDRMITNA